MQSTTILNPQQRQAIDHLGSPLLVLAGAGSGKTRVITHKIAHLIQQCGLEPRHITAVTFTNKAAREMKDRVGRLLPGNLSRNLTVSTFHSLGLGMLRKEYHRLGYRNGFSVYDAQDTEALLRELTDKDTFEIDRSGCRWQISQWKNALILPEAAQQQADDEVGFTHAKIYARYQRQLSAYNALDFDDLIVLPVKLLEEHNDARERWQNKIRHLLIDEYQDTNGAQYALMRLLVGINPGLTVVGDDDQSVYAWRGARPENLSLLVKDYPTLRVIKLEQNYRSTERILQTANRLIANNGHLFEKRLWSGQQLGEPVQIIPCKSPEHEAERVVSEILKSQFKHRDDYSNYAILYRGNHQARPLERVLREHHIPYKVSGSTSFFEHAEVKDVLAYLRLIANPDDDPAFLRIVNTPRREVGTATLEKLGQYANQRSIGLFAACQELGLSQHLSSRSRLRLEGFTDWVQEMSRKAQHGDPNHIARTMVDEIGYRDWLMETSKKPEVAERRMKNVAELLNWLDHLAKEKMGQSDGIAGLVAHLSLIGLLDRNSDEQSQNEVNLMTLHAAKGLEFAHVYIVGMEENLLPHHTSCEDKQLEEERRLAYVGITRAQRTLSLSFTTSRTRGGESCECEPSRFLKELPAEHVLWEDGASRASGPEVRERGKAHLANLKAILSQ